ncbi:MAG: polysaccharide biosynthesis/export family protein [Sphingomonas sp.]
MSIAILACVALAGCARPTLGGAEGLQVTSAASLPAPTPGDLITPTAAYYIGPMDTLKIDVFGIPAMADKEIQVDSGGQLSFPLIGPIQVAGKTPSDVANVIAAGLRTRHIRNPEVTVNLKESVSQVITVEGEVAQPGLYPVVGQMTLLRAIARAQGTTEFARLNYVVVFRTVKGQKYAALYDLRAIRKGKYEDPEIFANDIVMVGESNARRIFRDILQTVPLLSTPLLLAFQN